MKENFSDLLKYCFNELNPSDKTAVEARLIFDQATFEAIRGINRLRRRLHTKEAVLEYLEEKKSRTRRKLFPDDIP